MLMGNYFIMFFRDPMMLDQKATPAVGDARTSNAGG
jgi:hypothetical protein